MSDDTEKRSTGPWGWAGDWVREEKFWRDIGARVLAGVITAAIVYAGALLLGYLHSPEIGAGLLFALGMVGCGILVAGIVGLLHSVPARARAGRPIAVRIVVAGILSAATVAIAAGVVSDLLSP